MRFEFQSLGDTLISREILRFGDRAGDASPAFRSIANDLRDAERERFDTVGRGTWKPILPATLKAKLATGQDPRVLHATRLLRDSLTRKGAPDSLEVVTPSSLAFGTTVPYARFLQQGTSKMPARKPIGFTEPEKKAAVKVLQRYVITGHA